MKKLAKILVCIVVLFGVTSSGYCNDWRKLNTQVEKSGLDTPIHIGVGMASAALTYHYLPESMGPLLRNSLSFAVPILIGTVKELTDRNFSRDDIGEYAVGGALSLTIISLTF